MVELFVFHFPDADRSDIKNMPLIAGFQELIFRTKKGCPPGQPSASND
jgi:hypothetical protein